MRRSACDRVVAQRAGGVCVFGAVWCADVCVVRVRAWCARAVVIECMHAPIVCCARSGVAQGQRSKVCCCKDSSHHHLHPFSPSPRALVRLVLAHTVFSKLLWLTTVDLCRGRARVQQQPARPSTSRARPQVSASPPARTLRIVKPRARPRVSSSAP